VPHVPFSGDLGGEASELRALSFDSCAGNVSVSGFRYLPRAQAIAGVEWHGNGRIAGAGCGSRLSRSTTRNRKPRDTGQVCDFDEKAV